LNESLTIGALVKAATSTVTVTVTATATARTRKMAVAKPVIAQHQAVEPVVQTRSGRRAVKRVIFEAGINLERHLLKHIDIEIHMKELR
jgi:hypothetical protein